VIRTRVGYAGGLTPHPDYHNIGDHTETVQVDYDPQRLSYSQLLDIFWKSHNPSRQSGARQYLHAIFYHDDRQQTLALQSLEDVETQTEQAIRTAVEPLRGFTMAEDYHQKYLFKQHVVLKNDMLRFYPNHRDWVDSTAVARLNGFVGGHGSPSQLQRELDRLGLSDRGKAALSEIVNRRWRYDHQ
jgi:methionine-S-sulfoxide reductase